MSLTAPDDPFSPWGLTHWLPIALLLIGIAVLICAARSGRKASMRQRVVLAWLILLLETASHALGLLPSTFDPAHAFPFHLCDLAALAGIIALGTGARWAAGLLYFWGLTLAPQAVLTPALVFDFPHPAYWLFWGSHLLVIWAAVLMTWLTAFRPDWRSYAVTLAATVGWCVVMLGFNAAAGTNYLFVNAKPETASLLDLMGPWPWYLSVELLIVAGLWAAMTGPWTRLGASR